MIARYGRRALAVLVPIVSWVEGGASTRANARGPKTHSVTIRGFQYAPDPVTVAVGDTVVWANADPVPHTATAADKRWDSGGLGQGGSWRYVAQAKGSHAYLCSFHPGMQATLVVR